MSRPLRVFLCHASQDKPTVWKLHRYLKQHGIKPWLDQEDLLPGEDWEVEIPKALFASDVILVCLSKNSVNKEGFVQKEITFALDKAMEKPEGTIFIIPVKLEDCEIPRRLTRYQWVDLSRADGRKRLLMGLNKRVNDLGADVSPVILDDARRTTAPKSPKPEDKKPEEQIILQPIKEEIEEELRQEIPPPLEEKIPDAKFTQQKPFTKFLSPSALHSNGSNEAPQSQDDAWDDELVSKRVMKSQPKFRTVFITFIAVFLLFGTCYMLGMNYLTQNIHLVTVTASAPVDTVTPKPSTSTSVPFTPTPSSTKTPISTPTLVPESGSTMTGEKGEPLVYVPAGEFTMGDSSSDTPAHTVYLDAFWIDQTEVTNKQYQACVKAGKCDSPISTRHFSNSSYANHPVVYVNWNMAKAYCSWVGGDLPTEAQWEKAARSTDARTYPWGNDAPNKDLLNYNLNIGDTTAVGNYESGKSFYGAYDMAGNVWEWVNDYYQGDYYAGLGDNASNPLGPESGQYRVLRGGSWFSDLNYNARSANRSWNDPTNTNNLVGFRCSSSLP